MAGFDLNSFIGENRDFARGYTFYATVAGHEEHTKLVKSTRLPTSTIPVAEVNWQGNKYKLGTTQEYSEFTITYNVDPEDEVRKFYLQWVEGIHNVRNNLHGDAGPGGYMRNLILRHISHRSGATIMRYVLWYAWPSSIGELSLDYGTKEIASFDVTFNYQYHNVDGV
jgi:hypothetical protein